MNAELERLATLAGRGVKRKLIIAVLMGVPLALCLTGVYSRLSRQAVRRAWKEEAVLRIARLADDPAWRAQEIAALEAPCWASGQIAVMKNGDWIVCDGKFHDPGFDDIFVGKASDGKWYYSTFHFCQNNIVLHVEPQAPDLNTFKAKYSLREFDGKSDEALKKTWQRGKATSPAAD